MSWYKYSIECLSVGGGGSGGNDIWDFTGPGASVSTWLLGCFCRDCDGSFWRGSGSLQKPEAPGCQEACTLWPLLQATLMTGIGGGGSFLGLGVACGVSRPLGGRVTHLPKLHVCLVPQTNKSETAP